MIDNKEEPYITVDVIVTPEHEVIEKVGSGTRKVVIKAKREQKRIYIDKEKVKVWHKNLIWNRLNLRAGINPKTWEKSLNYYVETYEFDASKYPVCPKCKTNKFIRLRIMGHGVYHRCFRCDNTWGMPSLDPKSNFTYDKAIKLKDRRIVTKKEAIELFLSTQLYVDDMLRKKLGIKERI